VSRDPYDGEPFYCSICGVGFVEFAACEEVECVLETRAVSQARKLRRRPKSTDSGISSEG
jgi:hypothetical protein